MDLGALELQIFVSLVVVLGSAFVALICDYLKGNNEQLRERNIELRVRTEERERFAILNPSAWLSQFRGSPAPVAKAAEAEAAPVAAESVMQSHATVEGLAQVAEREASLASRADVGGDEVADVPSVAGFDVSERRRSRRKRGLAGATPGAAPGENSYDWVRPEVMARVARRAGGGQRHSEEETVEVVAEAESAVPLLAAPVEAANPMTVSLPEPSLPAEFAPTGRQTEMEQVAQSQTRPTSTPPVIMLRPLPAMKLADELQRIAETAQVAQASFTSQLLEDVIAASAAKPAGLAEPSAISSIAVVEESVASEIAQPVEVVAAAVSSFADSGVDAASSSPDRSGWMGERAPVVLSETLGGAESTVAGPPAVAEFASEGTEAAYAFASVEEVAELVAAPPEASEHLLQEPEIAFAFASSEDAAELLEAPPVVSETLVEEPETAYAFASIEDASELAEAPPVVPEYVAEETEMAYAFAAIEEATGLAEAPPVVSETLVEEPEKAYTFASIEDASELVEAPPVVSEYVAEEPETAYAFAAIEAAAELTEVPPVVSEYEAEEPETAYAFAAIEDAVGSVGAPPVVSEYLAEEPETAYAFEVPEYSNSALSEVLMAPEVAVPEPPPFVEELPFPILAAAASAEPSIVEEPAAAFASAYPTYDSLPPVVETPAYDWSGAEFAPLPETVFASEAFAAETYSDLPVPETVSSTQLPVLPMLAAEPEEPVATSMSSLSELLLPTGMQDVATYRRLLEMPNPMSGIVITISISEFNRLCTAVGEKDLPSLLDSVEVLMSSIVRDGDFGVKLAADQWVFVYRIDDNGFSQRRVAGLSEKLWDFQLRHLGLSNISFNWAAVNVHAERLSDAVAAAVERMEASRRGTKKSGTERARLVVNG